MFILDFFFVNFQIRQRERDCVPEQVDGLLQDVDRKEGDSRPRLHDDRFADSDSTLRRKRAEIRSFGLWKANDFGRRFRPSRGRLESRIASGRRSEDDGLLLGREDPEPVDHQLVQSLDRRSPDVERFRSSHDYFPIKI